MNNYPELEQKIRDEAEQSFNAQYDLKKNFEGNERQMNDARRRYVREQIDDWFLTTELHSSITIRRERYVEIRDEYYGSSITVYPPERGYDWSNTEQKKVVVSPAYINASTWSTGKADVVHVQRRTLQYLKMMEIAIDTQNEMNQPLVDWPDMISVFTQARLDRQEVVRYREAEKQKREEEAAKAKERAAKKSKA